MTTRLYFKQIPLILNILNILAILLEFTPTQ